MSCLSVPSHLPPPFLTAFWELLMIFPRFLCHFLLHSSRGCLGRAAESLWVSKPAGSPVPAMAPCPLQLCVKGDSCRAELIHSQHRDEISPPTADLRCLLVETGDISEWGQSCWALVPDPSEPGHVPCLTDRVYWNCRGMLIAVRLRLQLHCPGCAHRKHRGPGRFVGRWISWQKLPGLGSVCGMAAFEPIKTPLLQSPLCPRWSLLVVF